MKTINLTRVVLFVIIFISSTPLLLARMSGKITGIVRDKETGEQLKKVYLLIEGTSITDTTDENGRYFILNVPSGTYTLRASSIGYKSVFIEGVLVNIDLTTVINFEMEQTVTKGEVVRITAKQPSIQLDKSSTITFITEKDIVGIPSESFTELIPLQAGVVGGNVRGGQADGIMFYLDGISLRNPLAAYDEQGEEVYKGPDTDIRLGVELPEFAFNEIKMLTGGFSPEFGNVQDAVINIATKEGESKHSGRVR
jgi:CRP-like cAMP-binding protein